MKNIFNDGGTKTAPSKPKVKPGTREVPKKPSTPYKPGTGPKHKPKA